MKIVELRQTCEFAPSQWEGRLDDGREIYLRFRHGLVRVDIPYGTTLFQYRKSNDIADSFMELDEILSIAGLELAENVEVGQVEEINH